VKHGLLQRLKALEQTFGNFAATQQTVWCWLEWGFRCYARGIKPAHKHSRPFLELLDYESEEYAQAVSAGDEPILRAKYMAAWHQLFSAATEDLDDMITTAPSRAQDIIASNLPREWLEQIKADLSAKLRQQASARKAAPP